jgi:hypothetical protein
MTCVIKEVDENSFDADVFEKQLGLALIREHEGDAQKLLEAVLDFLKRKSNFFNQGDAKRRLLDAYRTVTGEVEHPSAGLKAGFLASTSGAAAKPAGVTTEQVPLTAVAMRGVLNCGHASWTCIRTGNSFAM